LKKLKSRAVKRISSTSRPRRPTQLEEPIAPETVEIMHSEVKATAETGGGTPATGRIVLGTSCTIHETRALREQMLAQAALPGPFEIDGSAVQQIDTAGVQLVVAFALDCLERNAAYVWKGRSPALEDAIRVLGVGALLECPG
jgi:phospholipid transport system transporter-binding protein